MRAIVRSGLFLIGGSVTAVLALAQPVSANAPATEPPAPGFVVPNDTWFGEQWYLFDWGQTIAGQIPTVPNIDIRAPEAWSITKGSPNVVVAVLDSGLITGHHDFDGALWTNPGESGDGRETNGVDDDHDGYVDDVHGWDFQDNDNDPTDYTEGSQNEDFAHGTAVASAIAARGGNGFGVTGVAPGVRLMILRTASVTIDKAIDYAAAHGAQVANISLTSALPGEGMPQAATAIKANPKLLVVTGAGNGGYDVETFLNDPCHVPTDNVVCVASTDEHDQLAAFSVAGATSSFGNVSVDLGAPGTDIVAAVAARDNVFDIAKAAPSDFTVNATSGVNWKVVGSQIQLSMATGATGTSSIELTTPIDISADRGCFVRYDLTSTLPNGVQLAERRSLDGPYGGSPSGAFVAGAQPQTSYDTFVVSGIKKLGIGFGLTLNGPATAAGTATIDNLTVACLAHESNPRAFGYTEGTSLSAPLTAGVAALVWSAHPGLTPGQVRQALMDGGAPDPNLVGKTVSGKRLDAYGALVAAAHLAGQEPVASAPVASAPVASAAGTSSGELVSKLLLPGTPLKAPNHRVGAAPAATKPTVKAAAPATPPKKAPVNNATAPKKKSSATLFTVIGGLIILLGVGGTGAAVKAKKKAQPIVITDEQAKAGVTAVLPEPAKKFVEWVRGLFAGQSKIGQQIATDKVKDNPDNTFTPESAANYKGYNLAGGGKAIADSAKNIAEETAKALKPDEVQWTTTERRITLDPQNPTTTPASPDTETGNPPP
jgi:hypothetical protein